MNEGAENGSDFASERIEDASDCPHPVFLNEHL